MDMFDYLRCDHPLPGTPPAFIRPGHEFQTKDTPSQGLETYVITGDGELTGWEVEDQYHGTIEFYDSNCVASDKGFWFTEDGQDYEYVTYQATFAKGKLTGIQETQRERHAALPRSALCQSPRPTREEVEAWKRRQTESLLGKTLWVEWGGLGRQKGYAVKVVAEDDRQLCVVTIEPDGAAGQMELLHRWSRDNTFFDSEADANVRHEQRESEQAAVLARYEALLGASFAARGVK
jgi:hypothetical protein